MRIIKFLQITPKILGKGIMVYPNMHYVNLDFSFVASKYNLIKSYEKVADLRKICLIAGKETEVNEWIEKEGKGFIKVLDREGINRLGKELQPEYEILLDDGTINNMTDEEKEKIVEREENGEIKKYLAYDGFDLDIYLERDERFKEFID